MRTAKPLDYDRIRKLKRQINDHRYIEHAIDRLAHRLTRELVERNGEQNDGSRGAEQEQR